MTDKLQGSTEGLTNTQTPGGEVKGKGRRGPSGGMILSYVLAVMLAGALIQPPFASSAEEKAGDSATVATVNGVAIKKQDLYNKLVEQESTKSLLNNMISEELIRQELEGAGVTASEEEINAELDKIKQNFPTEEEFQMALDQNNLTLEALKEQIETQVKIDNLLSAKVQVTDAQVQEHFEANKSSYDLPERVKASHILVETREQADDLLAQLEGGADFAALAAKHSLDQNSAPQGGELDYFPRGVMDPGFEEMAFNLPVGSMDIAESSYGFHIIHVTDHQQPKEATLEDNKDQIREQLEMEQLSVLTNEWYMNLQANAKVVNHLEPAEGAAAGEGEAEAAH
ncbi:peptidylprolyl isomerase [Paenibacillus sambharensis]|uniref:Peptidylprolyl isomerase n=1 Tax=Paenibacillus sambharensis TaxID=1803190 RepID=A0A2W1LBG6_9BACL|nr:peptidylprolyl isomerase [Paenibacillus sambharensis]PZD96079.1 peptidylprolyl isomerase [Paenibacillus sambharensis]